MTGDSNGPAYTHANDEAWSTVMRQRTAAKEAAFLLPYLQPGLSLVDVGCRQGTITADLAEPLSPGQVCGFDSQLEHVIRACRMAERRGLTNVIFRDGNGYEPPFETDSFDVAFAHMVFMHLTDPLEALRKAASLVKPGGLVATRDRGSSFHSEGPHRSQLARVMEIVVATRIRSPGVLTVMPSVK